MQFNFLVLLLQTEVKKFDYEFMFFSFYEMSVQTRIDGTVGVDLPFAFESWKEIFNFEVHLFKLQSLKDILFQCSELFDITIRLTTFITYFVYSLFRPHQLLPLLIFLYLQIPVFKFISHLLICGKFTIHSGVIIEFVDLHPLLRIETQHSFNQIFEIL